MEELPHLEYSKTCFFGNYPPKECGIATFTKNLSRAMDERFNPSLKSKVIAINEPSVNYNYPEKVINFINKEDIEHYINIAKKINEDDNIKIVCVQHEFGIFGGSLGSYIVPFLETLNKPVVITFHSVLPNPEPLRLSVVKSICSRAIAIIVMAKAGVDILEKDYGIEREKIHVVHHGIPNVPFCPDNTEIKKKLGLDKKIVLATFGLLSRGKGNEYVIKALPPLVKKYPNLIYRIIGKTHPVVKKQEGESYRNSLRRMVKRLDLTNNVEFVNKYPTYEELIENILASDIYIATNLEKNQITSGTLIEAMGYGGKAIVSTRSIYAEEVLADRRGITVDFKAPDEYTSAIDRILSNPEEKKEMERLAYAFSRQATWTNVAYQYLKIFNKVVELRKEIIEKFPQIKLTHLENLTDDLGIIQFANHSTPDKSTGYTLDDNARALIVAVLHNKLFNSPLSKDLMNIYFKFIENSREKDGRFKNNHKNNNEFTIPYSEDSFGRAIWALGFAINNSFNENIIEKSKEILDKSLDKISELDSPRAKSFSIIGLYHYCKKEQKEEILNKIKELANSLSELYEKESSENWLWFESNLTYSNAKIPEAMYLAYDITKEQKYLEIAEKTLGFLSDLMFVDGKLSPIGQNGWYLRNNERAFFDQQPIDASSIIHAFHTAYSVTNNKEFYEKAVLAFNWFLGHNHLNQMLYDETTGGCFDGIGRHSLNFNQGAESTVAYLIARLLMEDFKRKIKEDYKNNPQEDLKTV